MIISWNELRFTCHVAFCLTNEDYLLVETRQPGGRQKNTEDSPCANVNYINLCILCYDCLDLPGRPKTSKVRRRWAKDGNDQKTA